MLSLSRSRCDGVPVMLRRWCCDGVPVTSLWYPVHVAMVSQLMASWSRCDGGLQRLEHPSTRRAAPKPKRTPAAPAPKLRNARSSGALHPNSQAQQLWQRHPAAGPAPTLQRARPHFLQPSIEKRRPGIIRTTTSPNRLVVRRSKFSQILMVFEGTKPSNFQEIASVSIYIYI